MGVKLKDIIVSKEINLKDLEGTIIAIDAPNIIMSLFNFSYKNERYNYSNSKFMTDRTQRAISHLYGLLFRINFYYSKKIFPIFCYDGRVSELKRVITKDMLNDFRVTKQWYQDAIKSNNRKLARQIALSKEFLWPNMIEESKNLLGSLGIPYIESPASAESQCAYLVKKKIANYSNSQDYDSLLFGCPYVIQNLSKSLKRKVKGKWTYKKITSVVIELKENLEILGINQFQLVDMAILIGTDYFSGIKRIGPKTALELIKKHHNLETIISAEQENYDFNGLTDEKIKQIRRIFLLPDVISPFDNLQWDHPNYSRILELLCEDHTLNKERVENNLNKLISNYNNCYLYFDNQKLCPRSIQKTLDLNY